jgi:tetratricopeptide (TPR) repeat protein
MTFDARTSKTLKTTGLDFDIEMLEFVHEKHPDDIEVMAKLAELYTKAGRLNEGLAIDLRLVAQDPTNPYYHYNLACSYSLLNSIEDSLDALELAFRLGYDDADHMNSDPDFDNIKETARFRSLLYRMQK